MKLNRFLYFGDFIACPLVIAGMFAAVLALRDLTAAGFWLMAFAIGCGVWTLVEYVVHRWVYHSVIYFDKMHDAHHDEPNSLIGAPSFLSIVVIFAAFYAPLYFVNTTFAGGFTSGILLGYLGYQLVHHASHHWTLKPGSWLYKARLRHMAHHYRNVEGNYGIVTSFWDHVFSTAVETTRTRT
jgi:sterol desaturase/sphingolipid hydroxylase (fatty acid hydroxylase superfamily)